VLQLWGGVTACKIGASNRGPVDSAKPVTPLVAEGLLVGFSKCKMAEVLYQAAEGCVHTKSL
jgi:hypothetical protein